MGIVPNPETRGKNYLGYIDEPWEKVYASEINGIKADTYAIAASRSWQANKAYLEGDICYPSLDKGKSFMMLECVVPGTTGATEPTWGNINATQTDGSSTWLIKKIGSGEGGGGLSVGMTIQHLGKVPPEGFLALKGQEVGRLTYPELWDWVQNKSGLLVSEANWQTAYGLNSGNCGSYSDGDGTTTFRLPNVTGFLRPQGDSSRDVGEYQGDAIRNITGKYAPYNTYGAVAYYADEDLAVQGAFKKGAPTAYTTGFTANYSGYALQLDVSQVVPTAEENRPKSITVLFCVKAFDSAVNVGTVDITELANDVSTNSSKIDMLESKILDFTIIYPFGGDASNPGIATVNQRIALDNIWFPGQHVTAIAQILTTEGWGITGWLSNASGSVGGYGVNAGQLLSNDGTSDKIVIQTGNAQVMSVAYASGSLHGTLALNSAPCRVILINLGAR